jgi:hypothetical protein
MCINSKKLICFDYAGAVKEKRHRMVNPDDVDVAKRCVTELCSCGVFFVRGSIGNQKM